MFLGSSFFLTFLPYQVNGRNLFSHTLPKTAANFKVTGTDTISFLFWDPSEGICIFKDGIVFLSNSKFYNKMIPDHISFGKTGTYFSFIDSPDLNKGKSFIVDDAFPYLPESMTFTKDFSTIYFTQKVVGKEKNGIEKIYSVGIISKGNANRINPKSKNFTMLKFCNDTCRYLCPTLSNNDSIMIFSSNRKGSLGELDLFMVIKQGTEWSEPENLGARINTEYNEKYPFLDSQNNLFFSSQGHSGYGGYDIYVCKFTGNGWGTPLNLMKSVNSGFDEIAFSIHLDQKIGFYSMVTSSKKQQKRLFKIQASTSGVLSQELINKALAIYENLNGEKLDIDSPVFQIWKYTTDEQRGGEVALSNAGIEDEAAKAEELKKAEEMKKQEELRKAEELKKAEEMKKQEELRKTEELKKVEDRRKQEEIQKAEEMKKQEELRKAEELKKAEERRKQEELQKAEEMRKQEELRKVEELKKAQELKEAEESKSEIIIFRVQILSSMKPQIDFSEVNINNMKYETYEYFYLGEYRYTIGYFQNLEQAVEIQNICRDSGYKQAFVAAFKNNERITDPSVYKKQ